MTIARLAIKTKAGQLIVHDLTETEAWRLWEQLDELLPDRSDNLCPTWDGGPSSFSPAILAERHGVNLRVRLDDGLCPSWGALTGRSCAPAFSKEIRDEFDRTHPIPTVPVRRVA